MTEDERITLAREGIERDLREWVDSVLVVFDDATAYERVSAWIAGQVAKINEAPLEDRVRFLAAMIGEDQDLLAEKVDALTFKATVELIDGDPAMYDVHWHADVKMKPDVDLINVTFSLSLP